MSQISRNLRVAALLISSSSLLATFILVLVREPALSGDISYASTFWELIRYFTILTNFIVSYLLLFAAIKGNWHSFSLFTGATMWIWIVGVIYHVLLASNHNPTGVGAITNQIHHSVVPAGTFLIWLFAKPRTKIGEFEPFYWLSYPLGYTVYMLLRGQIDGIFPYHFSDPTTLGWTGFFINQAALLLFFWFWASLFDMRTISFTSPNLPDLDAQVPVAFDLPAAIILRG